MYVLERALLDAMLIRFPLATLIFADINTRNLCFLAYLDCNGTPGYLKLMSGRPAYIRIWITKLKRILV